MDYEMKCIKERSPVAKQQAESKYIILLHIRVELNLINKQEYEKIYC